MPKMITNEGTSTTRTTNGTVMTVAFSSARRELVRLLWSGSYESHSTKRHFISFYKSKAHVKVTPVMNGVFCVKGVDIASWCPKLHQLLALGSGARHQ